MAQVENTGEASTAITRQTATLGGAPIRESAAQGLSQAVPAAVVVNLPDNGLATRLIDPIKVGVFRPFKTVVVSQDPPAGQDVPTGTTVNLQLARVDEIPLSALTQAGGLSFQTLGALASVVNNAPAVKSAVAAAPSFNALSASDQTAFKSFLTTNGQAAADPAQAFDAVQLAATL